jgi:acyl-CoA synthetase (AMP-forming)/AMP-acid ligase II
VPTQVERLLALPDEVRAAADLSSVRAWIVAGAPFAPATKRRLLGWLGPGRLWEFYGSSETGTITVLPPAAQPGGPGSVGWPPAGVNVRLLDEAGAEVGPGVTGEVYVASPAVMRGYLSDPANQRDGHVSVGDLGRWEPDGSLTLVDRKHDLIISGGVNVYPAEVERALGEHPDVAGAVVTGVPDPDWGERVVALVAPRPGAHLDAATLYGFLRPRIATFKLPKQFAFCSLDELPLGPSGKPLRRVARAHAAFR